MSVNGTTGSLRVVSQTDADTGATAVNDQPPIADTWLSRKQAPLAIQVRDCKLAYPVSGFGQKSLKSLAMSVFGHREQKVVPTYVEALRGLNIEIQQGERVGLVGHNGSGKSTLLRALAGVYPLAGGSIRVSGSIGAIFDLGLGFEDEATGRENIYYRGMAMGFSRRMMAKHEAEIVEFCGLGDFVDLPVRTYSSGMYLRLAFAIATQFSPEILLVDEVFAAGDATFRARAVERMVNIVRRSGIFVMASHDPTLVQQVCSRAIWLEAGRIVADGPVDSVIPDFVKKLGGA